MKAFLTEILWLSSLVILVALLMSRPARIAEVDLNRLSMGMNLKTKKHGQRDALRKVFHKDLALNPK